MRLVVIVDNIMDFVDGIADGIGQCDLHHWREFRHHNSNCHCDRCGCIGTIQSGSVDDADGAHELAHREVSFGTAADWRSARRQDYLMKLRCTDPPP